jgi:hypothetical protein
MAYTWGDTIDETTDVFDVSLYNTIQAAVHERVLAAGWVQNINHGSYYTGGFENFTIADELTAKAGGDPLAKAVSTVGTSLATNGLCTVVDLQNRLGSAASAFIKNTATVPASFATWGTYELGEAIGYPESPNSGWIRLFRRKCPRRIYSLTTTRSQDFYGQYYIFGSYYPSLSTYGECEVGDRAHYYIPYTFGFDPPYSFISSTRVNGWYQGVYEYQGAGVWTKAPSGAEADTLDSNEEWDSHNWCLPGNFQIGDYYGWWLWRDLYEICKLFKWTYSSVSYKSGDNAELNANKIGYLTEKDADATGTHPNASEGAAKSSAAGDFTTAPEITNIGTHILSGPRWYTHWTGSGDYWYATITAAQAIAVAANYQGIPRTIDYYIRADPFGTFDDMGLGFTEGALGLWESKAYAAGAHDYLWDHSSTINPSWAYPGWSATNGGTRGCSLTDIKAVTKWNFTYA